MLRLAFYGGGYTLDYPATEFSFYKENGFDRIRAKNFCLRGEPGTPELPAVYLNYIIPPNAKAESLIISQVQFMQIPGEFYIYPAQPPRIIGETIPWVPPDTMIYNSDELFPGEFIRINGEGIMDGARIVTVEVRPLQYRPKTKRLFLVRPIGFDFAFTQRAIPELRAKVRGKNEQATYDAALRDLVVNHNEISVYYQKPAIVEENQLGSLAPFPIGPAIIIAPQEFHSAFQPYADWMTDQGIKTYLITPQTIYQYFSGVDNAERVRNYIKYCYENAGGTYFILGGDDYSTGGIEFVPVRYCFLPYMEFPIDSTFSIPCDMYFSDLTGVWDGDNDGLWGEMPEHGDTADYFPEVFVGRLTPFCVQEWVEKALFYEKTPQLLDSISLWFYDNLFPIGDAYTTFPEYIQHQFILMNNAQECVRKLSESNAFNNIHLFGLRTVFCDYWQTCNVHAYWPDSPSPQNAGLNHLENYNKYIFSSSLASFNGGYDSHLIVTPDTILEPSDTCIIDGFLDAYPSIGACAFLGYTRHNLVSYGLDLEHEFYKVLFSPYTGPYPPEPSCTRFSVAEALSKCGDKINWLDKWYRYVCYSHNYFGSPYTEVWSNQPRNFSVNHPRVVYVGIPTQLRITVRDAVTGYYVAHAKVCLNKPNDIYQVGYTGANGQITFIITPQTTGIIKVTVTRIHDNNTYIQYFPSQTTCQVLEPPGGGQSSDDSELLPTTLCIIDLNTISTNNLIINYGLPVYGNVSLILYNETGSMVRKVVQANLQPGFYKISLYTKNLSSGVYFLVLKQINEQVSKKFLLIR